MGAALRPLLAAQGDLDLSTEEAMQSQEQRRLALLRRYFIDWSEASDSDWTS
jgi:hypothetical protein